MSVFFSSTQSSAETNISFGDFFPHLKWSYSPQECFTSVMGGGGGGGGILGHPDITTMVDWA